MCLLRIQFPPWFLVSPRLVEYVTLPICLGAQLPASAEATARCGTLQALVGLSLAQDWSYPSFQVLLKHLVDQELGSCNSERCRALMILVQCRRRGGIANETVVSGLLHYQETVQNPGLYSLFVSLLCSTPWLLFIYLCLKRHSDWILWNAEIYWWHKPNGWVFLIAILEKQLQV